MKNNAYKILAERGFIKQTVNEPELKKLFEGGGAAFYIGFDPTADSLHIGHYIPIMAMSWLQKCGHTPVPLIGAGTAMVGDPSGRTDMRNMMTAETIGQNALKFKEQMKRFFSFEGKNAAVMVNNADWLKGLNYVEFLRDIGVHFSVNKMLTAECFKQRLEKGLSFLEFNYMLMQAYDYLKLYEKYGCRLQMGGNDQWSNILAGADLIRRKHGAEAFCITFPLLETSDGKKMGKTASGALWLSGEKTPPYEFFQYFRNVEDVKVAECMKLLTFMDLAEIGELTKYNDQRMNAAKERLAYEVTALVHGKEAAENALKQAVAAFGGDSASMPTVKIAASKETAVTEILVLTNAAASKSEARRLIEGGGVSIGEKRVQSFDDPLSAYCGGKEFVLHKGKKTHIKVVIG